MHSTDTDILKAAETRRREGRGVAIATMVETWGSAPRPFGSHLVIDEDTNFLGPSPAETSIVPYILEAVAKAVLGRDQRAGDFMVQCGSFAPILRP
jgi:xanthine/CO dehydrogenase XdhC/CoxF family maturation factor